MQIRLQKSVVGGAGRSLCPASQLMPFYGGPIFSYLTYTCSLYLPCVIMPLFLPHSCLVSPFLHLSHLPSHNKHFFFSTLSQKHIIFISEGLTGLVREAKDSVASLVKVGQQATLRGWRYCSRHPFFSQHQQSIYG